MVNSEERQWGSGGRNDDADPGAEVSNADDSADVSSSGGLTSVSATANQSVARRLTEIFVGNGDADLLLQRSDREDGVLRWIRALDMQVMGACRADERLKPLLKLNVSTGVADDRLLSHLNQHFEPVEVGLLARCLCIPLVSIRVGKINKQGAILSPTSIRGNLCLTLLPTSDLRLSFNGDDGSTERLATFGTEAQPSDVQIEAIPADKSGRSFLIKASDSLVSFFWCSEKSMLLGNEMLRKTKDLLVRKPSLAELSGISNSRLSCFATDLRACLTGSMLTNAQASADLSATFSDDSVHSSEVSSQSSFNSQKSARFRQHATQGSKTNLVHQGSLSPRSCSFKEGLQRSLSSIRSAAREKLRRRGDSYASCIDNISFSTSNATDPSGSSNKPPKLNGTLSFSTLNILDALGKSAKLPFSGQDTQVPLSVPSSVSPNYCWCPPVGSALQYAMGNPQKLPISSSESFSLPPLSSLLPSSGPSMLLTSKPLLNLAEIPSVDFPDLPPDSLVRLSTSQQIPTFTPFICDPIVHIPVIDVCSSGQGYLVSAGPAMSPVIPPLNPNLVDPLCPSTESMVERGARETLRMLISSSNSSNDTGKNVLVTGSRGLYSVTRDVDCSNISAMGLVFLSDKPTSGGCSRDDSINPKENPPSSGSYYNNNGNSFGEEID